MRIVITKYDVDQSAPCPEPYDGQDTTVTPNNLRDGVVAYGLVDGTMQKIVGTIPTILLGTDYTPSNVDQIIPVANKITDHNYYYLKGFNPPKPEMIKAGVTIFGVTGTAEIGTGGEEGEMTKEHLDWNDYSSSLYANETQLCRVPLAKRAVVSNPPPTAMAAGAYNTNGPMSLYNDYYHVQELRTINLLTGSNQWRNICNGMANLRFLELNVGSTLVMFNNGFDNCINLTDLTVNGNIQIQSANGLDFSWSTKLTQASMESLLASLVYNSSIPTVNYITVSTPTKTMMDNTGLTAQYSAKGFEVIVTDR